MLGNIFFYFILIIYELQTFRKCVFGLRHATDRRANNPHATDHQVQAEITELPI